MKKIYVKPTSAEIECSFEGMIAASGNKDGLHYDNNTTVDDGSVSYSNKQGWHSSLWDNEE